MIPVLYRKGLTAFNSLGIGPLPDTIECTVREERNGQYELEMRYPVTGLHYKDIEVGKIIRVRNAYCGLQPFDIYAISRPMNGVVTINAKHASYRLNKMVLRPCSGTTAASAMVAIGSHITYGPEDFTFWTDKTTQADWSTLVPVSVRAALGGTEGSVLDVYGGEFEWDNFEVKLHGTRGTDTGVTIKYGKNLLDIVAEENVAERFTACVPFYKARDDSVTIGSVVKTAEWNVIDNYIAPMDLTQYYEPPEGAADNWHPTTTQLEEKAQTLMTANAVSRIAQNLTVKFALLSQSEEYANLAALERVKLCDTVTVQHPGLGVDVKLKVIATTWNVLLDRYDDIELGQPKATLSQTIIGDLAEAFATLEEELADKVDWTHMDEAIENATDLLTGGTGGYVVIGRNAAGEPNEIFIMDQPDTTQAVSVIRLNKNGIGFSTQGINGPYTNAWTIDGHLVADFMDTGILSATIIKAGALADPNGNFVLDLPTGTMAMKKGSIDLGYNSTSNAYKFSIDNNGVLTTRYTDGDTAWNIDGSELRVYSDTTGNEVGEFSYRAWRPVGYTRAVECFDARFAGGAAFIVSSGLGSSQTTLFSVEEDRTSTWGDAYYYKPLRLTQIVVGTGGTVYQGDGFIGYEERNSDEAVLVIRENIKDARIEMTSNEGDMHVYTNNNNESQFQIHGAGARGLYLGKNGLLYNRGDGTWHKVCISNGSGGYMYAD